MCCRVIRLWFSYTSFRVCITIRLPPSPLDFSLTVGFEETSYTVAEGGDAMLVCAILTPSFDRNIFVEVVSLDGTAVGK